MHPFMTGSNSSLLGMRAQLNIGKAQSALDMFARGDNSTDAICENHLRRSGVD